MKIMRSTVWFPDITEGATIVVRGDDMSVPLEEIGGGEGMFVFEDIFEVPGAPDTVACTILAMGRRSPKSIQRERDMALLFYWTYAQFRLLKDGGTVASTEPAPLSEAEIRKVYRQLVNLSDYRGFTFSTFAEDGTPVRAKESA